MASIGHISAAAATARVDTTLALANLHFEVNLFTKRISPPIEYQGVGQHLAKPRLKEAQDGAQHTNARKLGLLFRRVLPATPGLIKAYGTRASEIARSAKANPKGEASSYGPFVDQIGADATTLWAAATSGHAAIQCHLLACMLARIWDAPEATSLWDEIITRRKMEVAAQLEAEGELDQDLMRAAAEQFPRDDLADWDASCRAWLRVADAEKAVQQTKLRLIINNLDLPVNTKPDTYESVLAAWTGAMEGLESLVGGTPLAAQSGGLLLGLMSWHLYPDLECLAATMPRVELGDHLFAEKGLLTIGLEPAPDREARSVYWSLPLARLRYYGLPVTKFSSTRTSDRDRLTVDELLFAWFCAYIKGWDSDASIPSGAVIEYAGDVALRLHNALAHELSGTLAGHGPSQSWLLLLSRIAAKWAASLDQRRAQSLRNLGRKFCCCFAEAPFQNIFTVNTYLEVALKLEDKVRLLREIATRLDSQEDPTEEYKYLIIYLYDYGGKRRPSFEIATACPEPGIERGGGGVVDSPHAPRAYRRWISPPLRVDSRDCEDEICEARIQQICGDSESAGYHSRSYPVFTRTPPQVYYHESSHQRHVADHVVTKHRPRAREQHRVRDNKPPVVMRLSQDSAYGYDVVFGDCQSIALLRRRGSMDVPSPQPVIHQYNKGGAKKANIGTTKPLYALSTKRLMNLFQPDRVDFVALAGHLKLDLKTNASLLGMTFIDDLYKNLGENATVDVRAAQFDLGKARWVKSAFGDMESNHDGGQGVVGYPPSPRATNNMNMATSFACIAMMETGSFNFDPSDLSSVLALCSADSLYIASALLSDPAQLLEDHHHHHQHAAGIRRVTGNIGRAGMALMIPPKSPAVRDYSVDDWYLYQHQTFDGVLDDSFGGTSLQLSFTGWKQEINVGTTGGKDVEAYYLETVISVYDRAKWIADLDVLETCRSDRLLTSFLSHRFCACSTSSTAAAAGPLISVGSFAEIIVAPSGPGIITARGNWQARLAAASICIAMGYRVILKPLNYCWPCLSKTSLNGESVSSIIEKSNALVMIL
ncbi:hypothetical protein C8A01DRAFT_13315 [Parachaetomium inaequale]|uniref:Uncharacterized protein n=1 Tax=Parachaetomium inaequale TaxID=2588326 RepID=A0AAN6PLG8_9PEZI|nr:hypothetical protein C8A01DRAFT_13315 [Parachaetomium inaequale]